MFWTLFSDFPVFGDEVKQNLSCLIYYPFISPLKLWLKFNFYCFTHFCTFRCLLKESGQKLLEGKLRFSAIKPRANARNIVGQQDAILLAPTCCERLHTMLCVVVCCCDMLEVVGWSLTSSVQTSSNKSQQHATTHNTGVQTIATCWAQQCCVLLANNVASVCTGLKSVVQFRPAMKYACLYPVSSLSTATDYENVAVLKGFFCM